jgi:hypothetical protein
MIQTVISERLANKEVIDFNSHQRGRKNQAFDVILMLNAV